MKFEVLKIDRNKGPYTQQEFVNVTIAYFCEVEQQTQQIQLPNGQVITAPIQQNLQTPTYEAKCIIWFTIPEWEKVKHKFVPRSEVKMELKEGKISFEVI